MPSTLASVLINVEVEASCGAGYGERSSERVNSRNGHRERGWDTRAGTIDLAIGAHRYWAARRSHPSLLTVPGFLMPESVLHPATRDQVDT